MTEHDKLKELFDRWVSGQGGEERQEELFRQLSLPGNEAVAGKLLEQLYNAPVETGLFDEGKRRKLAEGILHTFPGEKTPAAVHRGHFFKTAWVRYAWVRYAAAVIILLGVGIGVWMTSERHSAGITGKRIPADVKAGENVKPGGNRAILTLADGSVIVLDSAANGSLAEQGNTKIIKLNGGSLAYNPGNVTAGKAEYNTISTPRGGLYQITLTDGTRVWLNAASSVTFPVAFTGKERRVEVKGEVYLEVAPNAGMPFTVSVSGTEIEVLGTSFNVNAYPDEDALKTALLEGSVKVNKSKILKPGQQSFYNLQSRQLRVSTVNTDQVMAWKNGLFNFKDAGLKTVMKQLERWYDIDVKYEGAAPDIIFQGKMDRGVNLSEVLEMLTQMRVKFRMEGRTLIVINN